MNTYGLDEYLHGGEYPPMVEDELLDLGLAVQITIKKLEARIAELEEALRCKP